MSPSLVDTGKLKSEHHRLVQSPFLERCNAALHTVLKTATVQYGDVPF